MAIKRCKQPYPLSGSLGRAAKGFIDLHSTIEEPAALGEELSFHSHLHFHIYGKDIFLMHDIACLFNAIHDHVS